MSKKFKATEFVTALARGNISETIVKTGMVKEKEGAKDSLLYAEGATCTNWVEIPLNQIEEVEVLNTIRCKDRSHPFVNLYLKVPDLKNPVARMFAEMTRLPKAESPDLGAFNYTDALGVLGRFSGHNDEHFDRARLIMARNCPPAGLCNKACRFCNPRFPNSSWCKICDRCEYCTDY